MLKKSGLQPHNHKRNNHILLFLLLQLVKPEVLAKVRGRAESTLDEKSFELLFRTYFSSLCMFAMKYVPDLDTSKEIVHSVFINLWEKKEHIDTGKLMKSYLFTSVYNRSLNYIRDQKKFRHGDVSDGDLNISTNQDVDNNIEAAELEIQIRDSIESLPEKCRMIFTMNRFEGLKYNEISDKLDISVKTVEVQMSKALRILREKLKNYLVILLFLLYFF